MKIERLASSSDVHGIAKAARVFYDSAQPAAAAFDLSLSQYRRRESSRHIAGNNRSSDERTSRRSGRDATSADSKQHKPRLHDQASPAGLASPLMEVRQPGAGIASLINVPAEQRDSPRPTRGAGRNLLRTQNISATCIEVVVESSGTRFLLSRESDKWLISFPDQTLTSEQRDHLVQKMQEAFAARGLGEVEVVAS